MERVPRRVADEPAVSCLREAGRKRDIAQETFCASRRSEDMKALKEGLPCISVEGCGKYRLAAQWVEYPETTSPEADEEHAFFDWIFTVRVCSQAFQLLHLVSESGGMKYYT